MSNEYANKTAYDINDKRVNSIGAGKSKNSKLLMERLAHGKS